MIEVVILENVALNKPAFGDTSYGAPPSRGNDGIANDAGNWTHADYPTSNIPYPGEVDLAPNPYWEVDLEGTFDLDIIRITDRVGCCDPNRLEGSVVTLFDAAGEIVATETVEGLEGTTGQVVVFDNGGAGYDGVARIRVDGVDPFGFPIQYFQFGELEAGRITGTELIPKNWALGKTVACFDSSGFETGTWSGFPPGNLTDGSLASISHPLDMLSAEYGFEIDLEESVTIDSLEITGRGFRDNCCPERLQDTTLEILDADRNLVHQEVLDGQIIMTETVDLSDVNPVGRFVRLVNTFGADYGPQVGEVVVLGTTGPLAPFLVTEIVVDPESGNVSLEWNSSPGALYTVFASDVLDSLGGDVDDAVPSGGDVTAFEFVDSRILQGATERYYRIMRNP